MIGGYQQGEDRGFIDEGYTNGVWGWASKHLLSMGSLPLEKKIKIWRLY